MCFILFLISKIADRFRKLANWLFNIFKALDHLCLVMKQIDQFIKVIGIYHSNVPFYWHLFIFIDRGLWLGSNRFYNIQWFLSRLHDTSHVWYLKVFFFN